MTFSKAVLSILAIASLISGCGGHAVTQAPLEETRGLPTSVFAGSWTSASPTCLAVSSDSIIHSRTHTALYTDTYFQNTDTFFSDASCSTAVMTYKSTSTYQVGDSSITGTGYDFDSTAVAQVVNVASSTLVSALNSANASRSQCGVSFAMADTIILGHDCVLTTDVTTQLLPQTFSLIYIDTSMTPIRMYQGVATTNHDGTSDVQRHSVYSTDYLIRP